MIRQTVVAITAAAIGFGLTACDQSTHAQPERAGDTSTPSVPEWTPYLPAELPLPAVITFPDGSTLDAEVACAREGGDVSPDPLTCTVDIPVEGKTADGGQDH